MREKFINTSLTIAEVDVVEVDINELSDESINAIIDIIQRDVKITVEHANIIDIRLKLLKVKGNALHSRKKSD